MSPSFKPWMAALALFAAAPAGATAPAGVPPAAPPAAVAEAPLAPSWSRSYSLSDLGRNSDVLLLGIRNSEQLELPLRRDRLVSAAELQLEYLPSPALQAHLSHLRVYLNDRLMGVLPAAPAQPEQAGQPLRQSLPLDARLFGDFNRIRLEFVGHYTDICEDPAHSSLWLSLSQSSTIRLREQALLSHNDLAHFPAPFFDPRDTAPLQLSMVFAAAPTLGERQAAAVLASYFGSLGAWRGARFPVLFDRLPAVADDRPPPASVVFATNARRPAFLADRERFPAVSGPRVELLDHPDSPYAKLLLIQGRDEADLQRAVAALALGTPLLRGARVEIGELPALALRQPYDAPNWTPTDRPVRFAELMDYPQQLQVSGLRPAPVTLNINLPPDLFVWRSQGIPLRTHYRFSAPGNEDDSRLNILLNEQFIDSLALRGREQSRGLEELRLGLEGGEGGGQRDKLLLPALKVGANNRLSFEFNFASTLGSAQRDRCQTVLPVSVYGAIDEDSTLDLSGNHHYLAMPDLSAFAGSGFPFSRLADLSETRVLVPAEQGAQSLATLLEVFGALGAQIGYPAFGVRLLDAWPAGGDADADLLILDRLPEALLQRSDLALRLAAPFDRLLSGQPPAALRGAQPANAGAVPGAAVEIGASAPLAAVLGLQSPLHPQRSIVALLAHSDADHALLRDTLADPEQRAALRGSLALIRSSGVTSQVVGEPYYVGHLPWWLLLWFHLSAYPLLLAALSAGCVLLGAFLAWRLLRAVGRRRLGEE